MLLFATHRIAQPSRSTIARRFLLAACGFVVFAGLVAMGDYPAAVSSILLAPIIEEAARLYLLRQPNREAGPNFRAASYAALLFAVFELNNLVLMWTLGNAPSDEEIGLTPEIYLTISFPTHFVMDWIGHFAFGAVMVALWRRPILRYAAPVLCHAAINSNAYW
ncbi:MAG: CPBP family glutamic-type intramembrane protease [Oceanicaulis sp.]